MDYGIGMFLAGLARGAGIGLYSGFWRRLVCLRRRTRPDNLASA